MEGYYKDRLVDTDTFIKTAKPGEMYNVVDKDGNKVNEVMVTDAKQNNNFVGDYVYVMAKDEKKLDGNQISTEKSDKTLSYGKTGELNIIV